MYISGAHEPPKAAKERRTSKDILCSSPSHLLVITYMEDLCGTA